LEEVSEMTIKKLALPLVLCSTLACMGVGVDANASPPGEIVPVSITPNLQDYRVVASYPHDHEAWTQGLFWHNGSLYEGTGQEGKSAIREVNLTTGGIKRETRMGDEYFGEGIALVGNRIYQLT
jgi:glutamine cyclotransferase